MNMQAILHDIETLPPEKQEEAADFVAFLKTRIGIQKDQPKDASTVKASKSFYGHEDEEHEMLKLTGSINPVLKEVWDNEKDAEYGGNE